MSAARGCATARVLAPAEFTTFCTAGLMISHNVGIVLLLFETGSLGGVRVTSRS
jgi:hypothetical protein